MNILIIGSGAREHAIAKALKRSLEKVSIFCIGEYVNPGIQQLTEKYTTGNLLNIVDIVKKSHQWKIDFAMIGPENPLEVGLADALWKSEIPTIGPKQSLAQLETNKSFARGLMQKFNIPGFPLFKHFDSLHGVKEFLQQLGEDNYVVKANGLMSGKGVKVAGDHLHSLQDAFLFCEKLFNEKQTFVIEEKLIGQEFSLMCFCDGEHLIPMPMVQDHKRVFVNDEGPNTGGMGSYSDANHLLPFITKSDFSAAMEMNEKVLRALMQTCQEKYIGILYGSFMSTKNGIYCIEFNCRFGDPEVLNVLSILETDFVTICKSMLAGNLTSEKVKFSNLATVCKYAVPHGYPDKPVKNVLIDISNIKNHEQLFLGAVHQADGEIYATGGRTAAVVGVAKDIFTAEKDAEDEIQRINGPLFHRVDIGTRVLIDKRISQMKDIKLCD